MVIFVLGICTIITMLIGIPIAFSLGVSAFAAIVAMGDIPLQIIPQKIFAGMDSFPLLCIPFFILSGELMSQGQLTHQLLRFAILLIGKIRGGLALANVLASMFFGGMTGSAIADVSALGSVEIPMMIKAGYSRRFSAAITSASAVIGPVIPPSIPVVIYAISGNVSIGGLFLAGILPGVLVGIALMVASYVISCRRNVPVRQEPVNFAQLRKGFIEVLPALTMPLIIIGGIISGIFTPTEAAAVAVGYSFIVVVLIKRTVKVCQLPKMLVHSGVITSIVMIIAGTATIWGWVIAIEQLPSMLAESLRGMSPVAFLLCVNIILLIVGTFMDNIPVIIIFAPTLAPIAAQLGINPLHFGMIVCINTTLGLITPPLGQVLFIASPIAGISLEELSKEMISLFLVMVVALLAVSYIPFTTLWIPKMFGF